MIGKTCEAHKDGARGTSSSMGRGFGDRHMAHGNITIYSSFCASKITVRTGIKKVPFSCRMRRCSSMLLSA